jgi:hypothetical protein
MDAEDFGRRLGYFWACFFSQLKMASAASLSSSASGALYCKDTNWAVSSSRGFSSYFSEEREKRFAAVESVRQMIAEFEKEFGTSQCKTLIQCDLQTKEGQLKYGSQGLRKTICPRFVRWAVDYVANKYK